MRSYSSNFFDISRLAVETTHNTLTLQKRLVCALMLVLTLCQVALMVAHEVTGMTVLNLCAEILDGLESGIARRLDP